MLKVCKIVHIKSCAILIFDDSVRFLSMYCFAIVVHCETRYFTFSSINWCDVTKWIFNRQYQRKGSRQRRFGRPQGLPLLPLSKIGSVGGLPVFCAKLIRRGAIAETVSHNEYTYENFVVSWGPVFTKKSTTYLFCNRLSFEIYQCTAWPINKSGLK